MFYPKDWQADAVFGCTIAARGLWFEMMNVMHGCEPYGYLCENGKPMTDERAARRCGTSLSEYVALLAELEAAGIPRRTKSGIIFSKRMVEDEKQRIEWSNRQKKHRDAKNGVTRDVTQVSHQSHAVLHSPSPSPFPIKEREEKPQPAAIAADPSQPLADWIPLDAWASYMKLRRQKRAKVTSEAVDLLVRQLAAWRSEGQDVREILERSVMNGWTGLFPVEKNNGATQPKSFDAIRREEGDASTRRILERYRDSLGPSGEALPALTRRAGEANLHRPVKRAFSTED